MFPSSLCRVCLTENIRMLHIKNCKLIEIYEKLSSSSFNTEDGKPQTICYICYSQLVKSRRFSDMAHKSQIILQELVDKGTEVKHETINNKNHGLTHNLTVTAVLCMTINDTIHKGSWVKTKQDVPEGIKSKNNDNIEVNESTFEEEIDVSLLSSNQLNSLIKAALQGRDEIRFSENGKVDEGTIKTEDFIEIEECTLENDIGIGNTKNNKEKEQDMTNESSLVTVKVEQDLKGEITGKDEDFIENEECNIRTGHITKKIENSLLKERFTNEYDRESYFYCDVCNNKFVSKYQLVAHLKMHTSEKTFESHMQPRKKSYVCQGCDRAFKLKSNLSKHMRIHTGEKPYACQICKKKFAQNYDLTIHMRIHTGEKPFNCNKCDRAFAIKTHLSKHMLIHTRELPYCQKCDKTFARKYDLTIHMRIHTKEKPYACQKCGKAFSLQNSLATHMRNHTEQKLYACNICDMTFTLKNNLGCHMRIHTGKKLHACQICNRTFCQNNGLTSQMETHTYACSKCDIKFARKRTLTTHMRIHTEEKT